MMDSIPPEGQSDKNNTEPSNGSKEVSDGGQVKGVGFIQEVKCRIVIEKYCRNDESKESHHPLWIDMHRIGHHLIPAVSEDINHF